MSHAIVLPATALVAGVLLSVVEPWPDAIAVGLLLAAVGLACRAYVRREAWRLMVSVIAGSALVGITVGSRSERAARDPPALSALQLDEQDDASLVEGTLASDAQVAPDATILAIDVRRIRRRQRWLPTAVGISVAVNGQVSDVVVRTWRAGRTVRASVWLHEPSRYLDPGVPDQRLSLARRGVLLTGTVKSPALVEVTRRGTWIDEAAASIRDHVRQTVRASIGARSPPAAAIVIAVLIGDRTGLAPADEDVMRDAGTYHVIAISGGNIAILAACLLALGRVGFVHWRALHVGVAIALAGYALVAGGGSSVARATLTAIVYLGARSLDQQSDPAAAVAVAAATLACWSPLSLVEPAFGLTFGASVAILVIAPRVMALWPLSPMASVPAALLASSIAAEAGVLPLSAWFFSRMTVAGLALNFAAIPLMAVVQIGGLIVVAAATRLDGCGACHRDRALVGGRAAGVVGSARPRGPLGGLARSAASACRVVGVLPGRRDAREPIGLATNRTPRCWPMDDRGWCSLGGDNPVDSCRAVSRRGASRAAPGIVHRCRAG